MKHRLAPLDVVSADAEDSSYSSAGRGGRLRVEGRDVGGMSGATTTDSEFETNKVQISSPTTSSTKVYLPFIQFSLLLKIFILVMEKFYY